jgi:DNA polymerase III delta prime subunit
MDLEKHIDKNNLHHAYLIEGAREKILPEVFEFLEGLGIKTLGNPDFYNIQLDSLKIDDARNLKAYVADKSFSSEKRFFIISVNHFLLEAQNTLLKMFEEPTDNTHFFLIVSDVNSLLPTLISRFYLISTKQNLATEIKEAEKFIKLSLGDRINFLKELLVTEEEEIEETALIDSTRAKALKFLNALEFTLHSKLLKNSASLNTFSQIFKVRQFLRMPGSSVKTLMESVALVIPELKV